MRYIIVGVAFLIAIGLSGYAVYVLAKNIRNASSPNREVLIYKDFKAIRIWDDCGYIIVFYKNYNDTLYYPNRQTINTSCPK